MHLEDLLSRIADRLDDDARTPSRFAASGASPDHLRSLDLRTVQPPSRRPDGITGSLKTLAESVPGSGGYLVPTEIADEIVTLLRARSAVYRLGPTVIPVKKELAVTSLLTGATAGYVGENDRISVSEQTFGQDPLLRPKALAALVPVSNRLLRDTENPTVESVIRSDLAEVLALRADLAFLRGTGPDPEPIGIKNIPGLTPGPDLGPNGRQIEFDDLKDIPAALRTLNAPFNWPGWIFHPRLLNHLEKLKDADGHYIADAGLLTFDPTGGGGTLLGYPFRTTTQIPVTLTTGASHDTTDIYFSSDWQECWIGENEGLRLELSAEATYTTDNGDTWHSAWQQDQTVFRAVMTHDIGLRRPELFTVVQGARP